MNRLWKIQSLRGFQIPLVSIQMSWDCTFCLKFQNMLNNGRIRMETNPTEYPVSEYERYVRCVTATCCIMLGPLFSVNPLQ